MSQGIFPYSCAFTYDQLHTEESFKTNLKNCPSNFSTYKGWEYIGVLERSLKTERLYFHGLFYVPEGNIPDAEMEDQKLLLLFVGEVSPEIINQMKKANYRGSSCQHSFTNQLRADGKNAKARQAAQRRPRIRRPLQA